ncbi:transporter substrate-binding domain-containing protein [Microvirga sp. CF3062]|uniref:substrate-binding periplasmic protein n=1 Tax=Microvirga sp. CF3062 TaxID=3110182 RepID=UPI002E77531D|nr:transporter substrate-binding domain-containing protein [Microvirga sp. CF3062]MEE1658228.1 transporter substrate-binding domain-containing protein [Microvirga sp. CF3062]
MRMKMAAVLVGILAAGGCSDFPKDNAETLKQLQAGREMKVGVAHNPPWTVVAEGRIEGVEPALVTQWAESLGTKARFITGPTDALVEALYKRELDVLIMGLTDKTPHSGKLALSQPYLEVKTNLGVAPGQTPLADWTGQRIAVNPERLDLVAQVRELEAEPVPLEGGETPVPIMAGYDFELQRRGLKPTEDELSTENMVMAVIPGESALLLSLDRFLQAQDKDALKDKAMEALR